MRDRDRRRQRRPVRIVGPSRRARHHLADLVAVEPARLGELLGIDRDLLGQRLGQKADHQARRKRPGLRRQVAHAPAADARLFAHLAAHGLLERLARLDEAGEAREPGARPPPVAAEQAAPAVDREHDHHGIGTREVRGLAVRAASHPTGRCDPGRRAALGAEAVPGVPVEERARLREDRRLARPDLRSERAHVDQLGVAVGRDARAGRIDREVCAPVAETEEDQRRPGLDLPAPGPNRLPVERRRLAAREGLQVAQRQDARLRIVEQPGDPRPVFPALAGPVQRIAAEAVDVFHGYGSSFTDRPIAADRSIASISLWRLTARSKSTSKGPPPRRASAARAYACATLYGCPAGVLSGTNRYLAGTGIATIDALPWPACIWFGPRLRAPFALMIRAPSRPKISSRLPLGLEGT